MQHSSQINTLVGNAVGDQKFNPAEAKLATNLALGSRILSIGGHDDINQGQISARIPINQNHFLIKQALCGFDEATPNEILKADYCDKATPHKLAPPELPLHQAIYAIRGDVNAIVHSHATYALIFGAYDWDIEPISHEGACLHDQINRYTGTSQTILSMDVANDVAKSLEQAKVLLLRNHGCVVVGNSVKEAVILALVLERACKIQILARSIGEKYSVSQPEDIKPKQEYIFGPMSLRVFWDYYIRKVKKAWPEIMGW